MELLSVGGLASVMQGKEPSCQLTVQVLGFKPLNGNPLKQRLKLWDGSSEFTQAVLDLEGREDLEVPALHSVVRLGEVRVKPAGEKWALIVQGYSLLRPGAAVGRKLEASTSQVWSSLGDAVTPPASGVASQHLSTPAKARPASQTIPSPHKAQVKRNLADSFSAPEAKRQAGEQQLASHHVADITPYTNKYTVKVRVEQRGQARKVNTRNFSGSVLDCILSDSSGSIKLTAWSKEGQEDVARMEEQLKEGQVYLVTGAQVKPVQNTRYNSTGHHYELTWSRLTKVQGPLRGEVV